MFLIGPSRFFQAAPRPHTFAFEVYVILGAVTIYRLGYFFGIHIFFLSAVGSKLTAPRVCAQSEKKLAAIASSHLLVLRVVFFAGFGSFAIHCSGPVLCVHHTSTPLGT